LTARMEDSHDHLRCGATLLRMNIHRHTTAIVEHADGVIHMDGNFDAIAITGEGYVDGVVGNLEHHVVEASAVVGIADIHARTLANGVQTAQHLNVAGIVAGLCSHR